VQLKDAMCPPFLKYQYTPHKLLTEHPRLFIAKCYKMTSYRCDSVLYCIDCYLKLTNATELTATWRHLLIDGPNIRGEICHICKEKLFQVQSAVNCDECFSAYMNIATKVREAGNNPRNLKGFLYDILRDQLIRLFYVEDFDL